MKAIWIPSFYGNKFSLCKPGAHIVSGDKVLTEEDTRYKFKTLAEAQAECDRRNNSRRMPGPWRFKGCV